MRTSRFAAAYLRTARGGASMLDAFRAAKRQWSKIINTDIDAFLSTQRVRLGAFMDLLKADGSVYWASQKQREEAVAELIKSVFGLDAKETSDGIRTLLVKTAGIENQLEEVHAAVKSLTGAPSPRQPAPAGAVAEAEQGQPPMDSPMDHAQPPMDPPMDQTPDPFTPDDPFF